MFIGGMLTGMGVVGMFWAAWYNAQREHAFLERVKALEVRCSKSES